MNFGNLDEEYGKQNSKEIKNFIDNTEVLKSL